jgi:AcrR family transcriptional regulator
MSDADTTRARILEAAGTVFAEKGCDSATIREICQLAGANLAAVNYHFGDKQRLYVQTVKRAHQKLAEHAPLPKWPADTPARVKLRDFIETFLTRILTSDEGAWHIQLMTRELAAPQEACEAMVRDHIQPESLLLHDILSELLPPEAPAAKRRLIAFSIVGQCLHYRFGAAVIRLLTPPEEYRRFTPSHLAEHITEFTLAALGVDAVNPAAAALPAAAGAAGSAGRRELETAAAGETS